MPKEIQPSFTNVSHKFHISKKQILSPFPSSYKNSKTPPFTAKEEEEEKINNADQSLFESFRSFHRKECETSKRSRTTSLLLESPRFLGPPPPENLRRSSRFFVAAGSPSSLIMDETYYSSAARDSNSTAKEKAEGIGGNDSPTAEDDDLIAILTYSRSPYEDFRRSMQEIVEARVEHGGKVDWEFMEDLLFRYMEMNNEKFCRYIVRAFVDLAVVLRENSWRIPPRRWQWGGAGGGRLLKGGDVKLA